jgi:hypothetical protein
MDQSPPIPAYLTEPFHEAAWLYAEWTPPLPEGEVNIEGTPFTISEVCRLVSGFGDRLPETIFNMLSSYMRAGHAALAAKLAADRSYETGAHCLLKLIADRKAEFEPPRDRPATDANSGVRARRPSGRRW